MTVGFYLCAIVVLAFVVCAFIRSPFLTHAIYTYTDLIGFESVTDAYVLDKNDETLFIRENEVGTWQQRSGTDIRKIVQQEVVENCIAIYAL
jgi:hypothetical protein